MQSVGLRMPCISTTEVRCLPGDANVLPRDAELPMKSDLFLSDIETSLADEAEPCVLLNDAEGLWECDGTVANNFNHEIKPPGLTCENDLDSEACSISNNWGSGLSDVPHSNDS